MFHNLATSGSDVKTNGILSGIADRNIQSMLELYAK